jgi:hypothetical protein
MTLTRRFFASAGMAGRPRLAVAIFNTYCIAMGQFSADHWPMELKDLVHAFHNPGGKFLRGLKEDAQ